MPTYLISRTSLWGSPEDEDDERRKPPCPEAYTITRQWWDRRTFRSPEEHDARFPHEPWLSRGTEHQIQDGGIVRRMRDRLVWAVDAASVEELVQRYGQLVVSYDWRGPGETELLRVEIYDTYRE